MESWLRRPWIRRLLGWLSIMMLAGGVVLFSWPFLTNLWTDYRQGRLEDQFASAELRSAYRSRTVQPGDALTRIVIPKLGVDTIVVEGTTLSALRAGAGHYVGSALPCEPGNSSIAGHRTTYGKPFARVDGLAAGDRITLVTPLGRCDYEVTRGPWVTDPGDFEVVEEEGRGSLLTLTTCHPPGSAEERLIVRAKMVEGSYRI